MVHDRSDIAQDRLRIHLIAAAVLSVGLIWSYWPTLVELWSFWRHNPDYSVGQLVPLIVAYLVWTRRDELRRQPIAVCWWGLAVLLFAQAVRFVGLFYLYGSLERYSIVLSLAGVVLLLTGPGVSRRLIWVGLFLLLMVPLPNRIHYAVSLPLQDFAARSAVVGLEMLGHLVLRQGHVLYLSDETAIAVAEACSGLRMLTAFVVVSATLAFVVRRPPWQKAILVVSSLPVAILANTLRLIATALLYESSGSELAERFFHDFAGLTMMPLAVMVLAAELGVLQWIAMNRQVSQ